MGKWAKVDSNGKIVEIVDSASQPQPQSGFTFKQAAANAKVGDKAADQPEQQPQK